VPASHAPGIKYYPSLEGKPEELKKATADAWTGKFLHDGFIEGSYNGTDPIWRALDVRYDQVRRRRERRGGAYMRGSLTA
jgi:hypothetical protein